MRILFVHSGADLYGASRSLLRLSSRLVRDGHVINCVLPYEGPLVQALTKANVNVAIHRDLPVLTRIGVRSLRGILILLKNLIKSIYRLRQFVVDSRVDIVHTNTAIVLSSGIAAKLAGVPHVWHIRESFDEFGFLWRPYRAFISFFSTTIVCVSQAIADQFSHRTVADKVRVIHNGFPAEEFGSVEKQRIENFRRQFNLGNNRLVGVVGRIKFVRKGQEVLAKAIALLNGRFPDVKFLFIGSPFPGNEVHLERLMKLVKELGIEDRVVYTGDVEDMGAVYSALDISVLTSCQPEPFAGVVIESMAYGKPVIGTSIGGTREQIQHGITGILIEPNNPMQLKQALERLLSNESEARKMGEEGKRRFYCHFEFTKFYSQMISLYRSLVTDGMT